MQVREQLVKDISQILTGAERYFLYSVKQAELDYSLMRFNHLAQLPASQWQLVNIRKMKQSKHRRILNELKAVLDL